MFSLFDSYSRICILHNNGPRDWQFRALDISRFTHRHSALPLSSVLYWPRSQPLVLCSAARNYSQLRSTACTPHIPNVTPRHATRHLTPRHTSRHHSRHTTVQPIPGTTVAAADQSSVAPLLNDPGSRGYRIFRFFAPTKAV